MAGEAYGPAMSQPDHSLHEGHGRRSRSDPCRSPGGVRVGDTIRVAKVTDPPGTPDAAAAEPYVFADVDRQRSVTLLAAALALLALLALRWRGMLALLLPAHGHGHAP